MVLAKRRVIVQSFDRDMKRYYNHSEELQEIVLISFTIYKPEDKL